MANYSWFRVHHGMVSDPKWPLIARHSGQNVGTVVAVWTALLDYASQNATRGSVEGFYPDEIDALYGYNEGTTALVLEAMEERGMIVEGKIVSWDKRQNSKTAGQTSLPGEAMTSTERSRRYRERQRAQRNASNDTSCDTQRNATLGNADATACNAMQQNATNMQRDATAYKIREDKNREENIDPPLPPKGEPDAIAPADTESGSEEAYADVSVPEQPTPSPEATQSESLEAVQPVLSPEQPPKPKRKRTDYRRDDMQTVWNRLPIQEDEETFKKTWEKGCREGWIPDLETIMAALDWQIPMWAQREPQYVPGPVAYLRKRKWNDKPRAPAHPQFQRKRFDPDSYTREDFANLPENPDGSVDLKKLGVF